MQANEPTTVSDLFASYEKEKNKKTKNTNCDHTLVYGHHMDPTLWTSFSSRINTNCQDGKCPFCKKKVKPQRGRSKTRQLIFHMLTECSRYFT